MAPRTDRRSFLKTTAGGVAAGALVGTGCEPDKRDSFFRPTPEAPLTPTDQFFVNSIDGTPSVNTASFRMAVDGLVDDGLKLSQAELAERFEPAEVVATIVCVGNSPGGRLISTARFGGCRMADVLAAAGLRDEATGVVLEGADSFDAFVPIADAVDDDTLIAWEINGEPLPARHGSPLRALLPGRYGMWMCKWLKRLHPARDYHLLRPLEHALRDPDGALDVVSRVDRVERHGVSGIAVSGGGGIERVEVRLGRPGDEWRQAELTWNGPDDRVSPHAWTLWRLPADLEPGGVRVAVRAIDAAGAGQDGSTGAYGSGGRHDEVWQVL